MSKYINQLTDEELETFLKNNGYELAKDLTDHEGELIPAIDRDEENILIRARRLEQDELDAELKAYFLQKSPGLLTLFALTSMHGIFGNNVELIHCTDYSMSKFCITEDDEKTSEVLFSSYINYMSQKFPNYKEDIIEYYDNLPDDNENDATM